MTFEYKNEFVDEYPYLVYSPEADATASGNGGGETSGGQFVVTLTYDEQESYYTSDKTAQEIYDAFNSGLNCIAIDPDYGFVFYLVSARVFADNYMNVFTNVQAKTNPTGISVISTMISLIDGNEQFQTVEYNASSE